MHREQKKPQYVNGRWQIVLDCGTVVRHVDKHVLEDFLQWNDCRQQAAKQVCRPTQKQADAVSIVVACAVACAILALVAFGVSQWS